MFDIGFSELLLFGVIALIVLGPEKLPQAARTAGQWYGKLRRTVSTLQSEIEAELDLAETRQQMQQELAKIRQTEADMKREMAEMRGSLKEFESSQNEGLRANQKAPTQYDDDEKDHLRYQSKPNVATSDYSYGSNEEIEKDEEYFDEFSEGYICTDEGDDTLYANNDNSKEAIVTLATVAPALTRPWENMWFRLGTYDKARRLPPPPLLPNYKADALLYNGFVQPDLDAKMPAIEADELEFEPLEDLAVDNSSLATFSTDSNHTNAQNKSSNSSFSLNKDGED
ncbi:Sec-independent protein translocase protein TatB [uncultured Psychrobacter sp.]|uniref:Sec-independent protein translocase protein TatB n=1 Tax=uncultured Psychrobacter sp. TaxID=259303 RepID=UPI00345B16FC